jgi:hypothetical protein
MLLTLRKLPVIGLSFVHIINSNMRIVEKENPANQNSLFFFFFTKDQI